MADTGADTGADNDAVVDAFPWIKAVAEAGWERAEFPLMAVADWVDVEVVWVAAAANVFWVEIVLWVALESCCISSHTYSASLLQPISERALMSAL